jgi:hypothetical protein
MTFFLYCSELCPVLEMLSLEPAEIYKAVYKVFNILFRGFNSRSVFEERIAPCTEGLLYSKSQSPFLCTVELLRVLNKCGSINHKN